MHPNLIPLSAAALSADRKTTSVKVGVATDPAANDQPVTFDEVHADLSPPGKPLEA